MKGRGRSTSRSCSSHASGVKERQYSEPAVFELIGEWTGCGCGITRFGDHAPLGTWPLPCRGTVMTEVGCADQANWRVADRNMLDYSCPLSPVPCERSSRWMGLP